MNRINFLPERILRKRLSSRQLRRNAILLLLMVLVLGGVATLGQLRIAKASDQLGVYNGELAKLDDELKIIPDLQKKLSEAQIKARISNEVGSSVSAMQLMAEITNLLPDNTCVTALEFVAVESNPVADSKRPGAKSQPAVVQQRRVIMKLSGLAPTNMELAEFMVGLTNSPVFDEVKMGYSRIVPIRGRNRLACDFEITCVVTQ